MSRLLVSKSQTKNNSALDRLHKHCLMPDLARSAHAYMHVSRESDFDSFESNNLLFLIVACIVQLGYDIAES